MKQKANTTLARTESSPPSRLKKARRTADESSRACINAVLPLDVLADVLIGFTDPHYDWVCVQRVCRLWAAIIDTASVDRRRRSAFGYQTLHGDASRRKTDADTFRWRWPVGWRMRQFVCTAARHGHLEVLRWAAEEGCPWTDGVWEAAAEHGHLDVLRWAISRGRECQPAWCVAAVRGGHAHVVEWLLRLKGGTHWDAGACAAAAGRGDLAMLQRLRAAGCPWDAGVFSVAAACGHVEIMRWAHAHGCPWDERACRMAAMRGHLAVLEWASSTGRAWFADLCADLASQYGHRHVTQWIRGRS
jgi:hypothetical protein